MKEEIKDSRRQRIGYIDRQLNGKSTVYDKMNMRIGEIKPEGHRLVAYNKMNLRMGYWDENSDATFDKNNHRIAKGNVLLDMYFQQ